MVAPTFSIRPVAAANWSDFEALFEGRGAPKYCWCMAWRPMEERGSADNAARKQALHHRVQTGVPIGLLGYLDDEPVGWCSVAPRESFLKLSPHQDDGEAAVWSIVCFFVRRDHRKAGLSRTLLDAAVAYARGRGARVVEAYPVDPSSPSYRFMGFVELFTGRGFVPGGKAGSRRQVMRLAL
ncbi:GNAT family N-acetyltransferase [Labrys sp. KNU-23]|uniref:GNAT family N-acetyltransferase n=1 Tax=Labrys sp. KNU-23 TaxID=2789216 RepID=UPI0011F05C50|nr:GNAT family N-acetyltransferase [Labrys sp. KNU-23]QEN89024.1 GNAT family N-acetyltransferase [Labrys sp. KNU-23]